MPWWTNYERGVIHGAVVAALVTSVSWIVLTWLFR